MTLTSSCVPAKTDCETAVGSRPADRLSHVTSYTCVSYAGTSGFWRAAHTRCVRRGLHCIQHKVTTYSFLERLHYVIGLSSHLACLKTGWAYASVACTTVVVEHLSEA